MFCGLLRRKRENKNKNKNNSNNGLTESPVYHATYLAVINLGNKIGQEF